MKSFRVAIATGLAMLSIPAAHRSATAGLNYSYATFDVPGAVGTYVEGISSNGSSIAGYSTNSRSARVGFLETNGTLSTLSVAGSVSTMALGVNDSGTVVGVYGTAGSRASGTVDHGFVYSNGQYTTLTIAGATLRR